MANEQHTNVTLGLQLGNQLENLRLNRHIERGRRFIGNQQLGLIDERHRDHHSLAHAARELVGEGTHCPLRVANTDLIKERHRLLAGRAFG